MKSFLPRSAFEWWSYGLRPSWIVRGGHEMVMCCHESLGTFFINYT
jgi:hypothetical protein